MFKEKRIGAVLLMGGEGLRFGTELPKQFHLLGSKPVFQYALDTLLDSQLFDEIVLVCHPDWLDQVQTNLNIILGGTTRQVSSYQGLKAFKTPPDIVLIHDAVRPFVTKSILEENVLGAIQWGATDTCIPSADTIVHAPKKTTIASIPKREEYLRGQTPQTFRYDWILNAHEKALQEGIENVSDDCRLVLDAGYPVHIVLGNEQNLKITSEMDLSIASFLMTKNISLLANYGS
jgi:2-C-methyl-D-erythritol 4-phosphate cytidylyltransferase